MLSTAVVTMADEVLGSASVEVHGRFGLLRSVVVAPELRGRNWGERLVRNRIAWARERGLDALVLFSETAAPFFEKLGFMDSERSEIPAEMHASFEFEFCPATSKVMQLDLRASRGS